MEGVKGQTDAFFVDSGQEACASFLDHSQADGSCSPNDLRSVRFLDSGL